MSIVLKDINPGDFETTDGRFFDAEKMVETAEITPPEKLLGAYLGDHEQQLAAHAGLNLLNRYLAAKNTADTFSRFPALATQTSPEKARSHEMQSKALWERAGDEISSSVASNFPDQIWPGSLFGNEKILYVTDKHKIFRFEYVSELDAESMEIEDKLNIYALSSFISQAEMNADVRLATPEIWQEVLSHIMFGSAKK